MLDRLPEHQRDFKRKDRDKVMVDHALGCKHIMDYENAEILDYHKNDKTTKN